MIYSGKFLGDSASWYSRFRSRPKLSYDQTIQTEMTSDQTLQTKMSSDQTEPRPWSRLKRLWSDRPDRIDLWSDRNQTMVQTIVRSNCFPDPVISVWEGNTGVRSIGSDHSSIWVWTKTWDIRSCTHLDNLSKHDGVYCINLAVLHVNKATHFW